MISSSSASILSKRILSTLWRSTRTSSLKVQSWKDASNTENHQRLFSTSRPHRELMDLTGFTEEQLTVREAVSQVCSQFPSSYWQERDQEERDPKEFHAALAKDGWLGIALPEELGGSGLGMKRL
jgi:acyl-CoA dehydrogenase